MFGWKRNKRRHFDFAQSTELLTLTLLDGQENSLRLRSVSDGEF